MTDVVEQAQRLHEWNAWDTALIVAVIACVAFVLFDLVSACRGSVPWRRGGRP